MTSKHIMVSNECCGCRACEQICPVGAITTEPNDEGFLYPRLDESKCLDCGKCLSACPCEDAQGFKIPRSVYAAYHKDMQVLAQSTSGGCFSAVTDYVLSKNGAVVGCVLDEHFNAVHVVGEENEIVGKMRGSKYVQSDTLCVFLEVQRRLNEGQLVLFTGTPCQVHGLTRFVGKAYDNLITMDFACHGIPSPMLLRDYLNDFFMQNGNITEICFRDKNRYGWSEMGSITYQKGRKLKTRMISANNSSYYQLFLKGMVSRMCCYSCKYAKTERIADITVGDCWSVNAFCPAVKTDGGVSAVLLNSEKAIQLLPFLQERMVLQEVALRDVARANGSFFGHSDPPAERFDIYKRIRTQGYAAVVSTTCRYQRVLPFLRRHIPAPLKAALRKLVK